GQPVAGAGALPRRVRDAQPAAQRRTAAAHPDPAGDRAGGAGAHRPDPPGPGRAGAGPVATPGVLALAIMSTAFTSNAIATGFDRRAGALQLLATTPLGRSGLLGGKVVGVFAVELVQIVVLSALAVALGWRPVLGGLPVAVGAVLLGTAAFTALALLIAGTLRADAVLAGANLLWLLLVVGGGVIFPASGMLSYLP